jgi:hypothetical protein
VRAFDRAEGGGLAHRAAFDARSGIAGRGPHSTPLWIGREEAGALGAAGAKPGDVVAFPPSLLRRLVRFYLVPAPY